MEQPAPPQFKARLFATGGADTAVAWNELPSLSVDDDSLLWIDLLEDSPAALAWLLDLLGFPAEAGAFREDGTNPALGKHGELFWLRAVAISEGGHQEDVRGVVMTLFAARNTVISVHNQSLGFLEALRSREQGGSAVGALSADSFVASLLDWQLSTYFSAISEYELAIERLEVNILEETSVLCLAELGRLRRWASRLRRMLAPHRNVFAALSRPDFRPDAPRDATRHFEVLDARFERAMDMVENARELVLGSFSLFSSQTALQTNDRMRVLTFVTVITGGLATLVGALGMNFDASFFRTHDTGFWIAVAGLGLLTLTAVSVARWRRWL